MAAGREYLNGLCDEMAVCWPKNRAINIVCHGHSVPAGYFATPYVNPFGAYPHLLHRILKERFPFAVVNVIVTAIGGEDSQSGAERFERDVLTHKPDVITVDYGLNDRRIGLKKAEAAWARMIEAALESSKKVILLTPSWDNTYFKQNDAWHELEKHREQIIGLADRYGIGLADSFGAFEKNIQTGMDLVQYLSHGNHPTQKGHELIAAEIGKYFLAR